MRKGISRAGKAALAAGVLITAFWLTLVFSNKLRLATDKAYLRLEEAWPAQKPAFQRLMPVLYNLGLLRPARRTLEPGVRFLLDPRDLVSATILSTGAWQPEVWDALASVLAPGSVLLDVGAHIGYFSLKGAARVGKTGRVVAFEPNPETLRLLRGNVAASRAQNVVVEPVACSDRDQALTLYAAPAVNTGASSLARENADIGGPAPKPYAVRGRPIDDVVRELKLARVDAIKIDVEGAEVGVLRGAAETLRRFHPKVVIEVVASQLASFHTTPDDVAALFRAAGYNHTKAVDESDREWTYLAPSNSGSTLRVADAATSSQLLRGFYNLEFNAWRWTDQNFTLELRRPDGAQQAGAWLTLKLTVPEAAVRQLNSLTLVAKIEGASLEPETYTTAGRYEYRRRVPASALRREMVDVDFALDKSLPPTPADPRRLGVIVTSAGLE